MARRVFRLLLALALSIPGFCRADWQLVWSDEFNQPDGSSPDPTKWGYDTGNGGYGNNELENYTSRTNNARIMGGQLIIEADQENFGGSSYTSARLLTRGKWSWTYGRIEARIKIPRGQGIWPAFWMLGDNIGSVNWPGCGEIDIMENIGKPTEQRKVYGTIHGPQSGGDYNGGAGVGGSYSLPVGAFADDYHVFAVEWTTNQIKWLMDSNQYFSATPASLPGGSTWVFTQPQFLLLNVAVGGNWPGYPDATTVFPQQMLVDYVRVYRQVAAVPGPIAVSIQTGRQISWPTASGTTWTLQAAASSNAWSNLLGPAAGDGATNSYFDARSPGPDTQYRVLQATAGAGNIVTNPGFEAGTGSLADMWSSNGSQLPTRVSTGAHGGNYCMRLLVTNTASTPNTSEIDQNITAAGGIMVVPGQSYTLSFWAKQISSGVSYVQNYGISWLNSSGGMVGSTGLKSFSAGNGVWLQFVITNLTAPANAVNAYLQIYGATGAVQNGYGGVLIDDVALAFPTAGQTNVVAAAVRPVVQITWPGIVGASFDVQWTCGLGSVTWSTLASSVVGSAGANLVFDLLTTNQSRFYRVVQLP